MSSTVAVDGGGGGLVLRHIRQLVTVCTDPLKASRCKVGEEQNHLDILEEGVVSITAEGVIDFVGSEKVWAERMGEKRQAKVEMDCRDFVVLPGLVDGHTHPVWAGDRCQEFARKLAGATYMEIHQVRTTNRHHNNLCTYQTQETLESSIHSLLIHSYSLACICAVSLLSEWWRH